MIIISVYRYIRIIYNDYTIVYNNSHTYYNSGSGRFREEIVLRKKDLFVYLFVYNPYL